MKKTLFAAALASVLALTGFALSAQESADNASGHAFAEKSKIQFNETSSAFSSSGGEMRIVFAAKNNDLLDNLQTYADREVDGKRYGFLADGQFVSLQTALKSTEDSSSNVVRLKKFSAQNLQFGIGSDSSDFKAFSGVPSDVSADPQFYGGYNADSFYSVDFAENPFDGLIDILVMGEPLPAPAVTLIIALAAGAALLFFKNRKQRAVRSEQA